VVTARWLLSVGLSSPALTLGLAAGASQSTCYNTAALALRWPHYVLFLTGGKNFVGFFLDEEKKEIT